MRFTHGVTKHTPEATVTWAISCGNRTAFITQEREIIDKLKHKDITPLFKAQTAIPRLCRKLHLTVWVYSSLLCLSIFFLLFFEVFRKAVGFSSLAQP